PDVTQPENRGPVRHHGHCVALDRVLERLVRVLMNGPAHPRHPRRVRHREVVPRLQRALVPDLDLAPDVQQERPVRGVHDPPPPPHVPPPPTPLPVRSPPPSRRVSPASCSPPPPAPDRPPRSGRPPRRSPKPPAPASPVGARSRPSG